MRGSWGCAAALALTSALLAGCGGEDSAREKPPSPEKAVEDGVAALRAAGTATFTTRVDLSGLTVDQRGTFTIKGKAQQTTTTIDTGRTQIKVRSISIKDAFYVSFPDTDRSPTRCYLTGDPEKVATLSGADLSGQASNLPGAALVAASAQGRTYADDGEVAGSVDLARAVDLVAGTALAARLGISPGDHRVDAVLTVDDGVLTGFAVGGEALNEAAEKANGPGGDAPFPAESTIEGSFTDLGEPVTISAPGKKLLVPLDQGDATFGSAADRCQAG